MNQPLPPENILMHYGVLGMKWGVRKDRKTGVRKGTPIKGTKAAKRKPSSDHVRAKNIGKKRVSEMSNQELRDYNERKRLVQEYNRVRQQGRSRTNQKLRQAGNLMLRIAYDANKGNIQRSLKNSGYDSFAELVNKYGDSIVSAATRTQQKKKRR